ncbi:MAG: WxL domain-containing protein [Gaiellaceae bacterium]
MNYRSKIAAISTALLGTIVLVPAALAADDTSVTVTGGSLAMSTPLAADFAGVTLDGTAKSSTAALSAFSATDSRGGGLGWNLTVQATQFAEYATGAYVVSGKTLPAGSLAMPAPTVTANGTTSADPTIQAGAPWAIDAASAVKFTSAALDAGMGTYDFGAVTLSLSIPASAYAKTYRSDVTFSAVSGP